jgi:hypothetical protein
MASDTVIVTLYNVHGLVAVAGKASKTATLPHPYASTTILSRL